MHRYVMPESVKNRIIRRQGKLLSHDTIDAARTALIVIDMQNYFVTKGFPAEIAPCVYRKPKPERNGDEGRQGSRVNL
jgi:ureidoacrylate peracid hydrolase